MTIGMRSQGVFGSEGRDVGDQGQLYHCLRGRQRFGEAGSPKKREGRAGGGGGGAYPSIIRSASTEMP